MRSESLKRIHFRIRYQTYCVKKNYEPRDAYPDGLERDEHDAYAEHFLVRSNACSKPGQWVGTMRLIPPRKERSSTALDASTIEVSRLIVSDPEARGSSRVLYLLCQAAQAYAVEQAYTHLSFLVRPGLARILKRHGLPIEQAGEACDHRGVRIPYRIHAEKAREGLERWRARLGLPASASSSALHYTSCSSAHCPLGYSDGHHPAGKNPEAELSL
nr:GNAT family N-acyltransferase [Thioalkalivibrio sp. ALJ24]